MNGFVRRENRQLFNTTARSNKYSFKPTKQNNKTTRAYQYAHYTRSFQTHHAMRRDSRTLVFLLPESCRRSPTPHPSLSDGVMELCAPLRSAEASDPTYSPCPPQEHLRRPRLVRLGSRQTSSLLAGGGTRSNTGVRYWFKWKEFGQLISAVSPV